MFLMLYRHTKSSWSQPGMQDHDRLLNKRGVAAAAAMADHISGGPCLPDYIICSTAERTRQTLAPLLDKLGDSAPEPVFSRSIYEAPASAYRAAIAEAPPGSNVLVVGHNPTTEMLALELTRSKSGTPSAELLQNIALGYPTGGLTIIEFPDGPWDEALQKQGDFVSFTAPKMLQHAQ
jgi:phosphohistidine phosphatase